MPLPVVLLFLYMPGLLPGLLPGLDLVFSLSLSLKNGMTIGSQTYAESVNSPAG